MERRDEYHRRYDAFKSRGHPFWPYTIFEDTVVALGVLLILLFLAIFVGTPLERAADPTNTAYIPRPEWYFMFLFELLKLFPAHLEWVGAALVPALGLLALLLLPFMDAAVLGWMLSIVAGFMIFIAFDELMPIAHSYATEHLAIVGVTTGMIVMALSLALLY